MREYNAAIGLPAPAAGTAAPGLGGTAETAEASDAWRRDSGRAPSLIGGMALAAVTVTLCLLAGEAISRLLDPAASLWRWPSYLAEVSEPAPGNTSRRLSVGS